MCAGSAMPAMAKVMFLDPPAGVHSAIYCCWQLHRLRGALTQVSRKAGIFINVRVEASHSAFENLVLCNPIARLRECLYSARTPCVRLFTAQKHFGAHACGSKAVKFHEICCLPSQQ
jgi:hypothetical protein